MTVTTEERETVRKYRETKTLLYEWDREKEDEMCDEELEETT